MNESTGKPSATSQGHRARIDSFQLIGGPFDGEVRELASNYGSIILNSAVIAGRKHHYERGKWQGKTALIHSEIVG